MKLRSVLLLLALFVAVQAIAQAPATPAPAQGTAPAAQKKQITDPEEYKMYVAALGQTDPAKKAAELDAFLKKYPNTPVKDDALEAKMTAEASSGQAAAAQQTARQLLQINPRNVPALNLLVSLFLQIGVAPTDPQFEQKLNDVEQWSKTGLEALQTFAPPNVPAQQLEQAKKETAAMFHQALGLEATARKNFPTAQQELTQAAELNPNNALIFYQLGNAYLSERPTPNYSKAMYAFARAAAYTGPGALPEGTRKQIDSYLTNTLYVKYHGSVQGLAELKAQAAANPFPPADFHIMSASEVAAAAPVEPDKLDFPEIRDMLMSNTPKSEELWSKLKGTTRKFPGMVVSATPAAKPKTLRLAVTQETAKKADDSYDVELALAAPVLPAKAPLGKIVEFSGVVNAFTKDPFHLTMVDGKIEGAPEEKPAAKKAPPARKAAKKR